MKVIEISKKSSIQKIIKLINENFIQERKKYTLIKFHKDISRLECEKMVSSIKKYFDIFIILKTVASQDIKIIEEYFSYGVHGIYFKEEVSFFTSAQLDQISYSTKLFPEGLVFVYVSNNKSLAEKILDQNAIPVVSKNNKALIDFIKNKGSASNCLKYLKYIPVLEENVCEFSFIDNIEIKIKLESLNLRQKLMVKNIEDSFNSSGL